MRGTVGEIRLDKWLWAARFFKTRALAAEAVTGGKVHLNGTRTKPGKPVRAGDELRVHRGPFETIVLVRALAERRGPATEAARLYEETAESKAARAAVADTRRAGAAGHPARLGRPSKKARRESIRLMRRGE
jgi:ribosome-associated heat shock protein Hsp15